MHAQTFGMRQKTTKAPAEVLALFRGGACGEPGHDVRTCEQPHQGIIAQVSCEL